MLLEHPGDPLLVARVRRRAFDLLSPYEREIRAVRHALARRYLKGEGVEIGALYVPLRMPRGARVRYVDRMTVGELRAEYPELRHRDLVAVDLVDDGEVLTSIADASLDFVIANHFIEHTENPIGTLVNHLRVLRPGGVVYMAVPDKRHTFDVNREVTPLDHLWRDYREGPAWSRAGHFEEWVRIVEGVAEEEVGRRARTLDRAGFSIYYHVWTSDAFVAFLVDCAGARLPFELEAFQRVHHEFIAILRKQGRAPAVASTTGSREREREIPTPREGVAAGATNYDAGAEGSPPKKSR